MSRKTLLDIGLTILVIAPLSFCLALLVGPAKPQPQPALVAEVTRAPIVSFRSGVDDLLGSSLLVDAKAGSGSGVCVVNGRTWVWTAAHVVADDRQVRTVIDPVTGLPRVEVSYGDVTLVRHITSEGRKVGERRHLARIIRYSDVYRGHDLALLMPYEADLGAGQGVAFLEDGDIPPPGEPLWHVGSMAGEFGANSVTAGSFAFAGRLRHLCKPNDSLGVPFDQVSLTALGGSSGGGVYRQRDGRCVGLLVEGLNARSEGANMVVPARRIREVARELDCLWAVDTSVPPPPDGSAVLGPRTRENLDLPAEWRAPAPKPAESATPTIIPLPVLPAP